MTENLVVGNIRVLISGENAIPNSDAPAVVKDGIIAHWQPTGGSQWATYGADTTLTIAFQSAISANSIMIYLCPKSATNWPENQQFPVGVKITYIDTNDVEQIFVASNFNNWLGVADVDDSGKASGIYWVSGAGVLALCRDDFSDVIMKKIKIYFLPESQGGAGINKITEIKVNSIKEVYPTNVRLNEIRDTDDRYKGFDTTLTFVDPFLNIKNQFVFGQEVFIWASVKDVSRYFSHQTVNSIEYDPENKITSVKMSNILANLQNRIVDVNTPVLIGQSDNKIIEMILLQGNIHRDFCELSVIGTNFNYIPERKNLLDELTSVIQACGDVGYFFSDNKLIIKSRSQTVPTLATYGNDGGYWRGQVDNPNLSTFRFTPPATSDECWNKLVSDNNWLTKTGTYWSINQYFDFATLIIPPVVDVPGANITIKSKVDTKYYNNSYWKETHTAAWRIWFYDTGNLLKLSLGSFTIQITTTGRFSFSHDMKINFFLGLASGEPPQWYAILSIVFDDRFTYTYNWSGYPSGDWSILKIENIGNSGTNWQVFAVGGAGYCADAPLFAISTPDAYSYNTEYEKSVQGYLVGRYSYTTSDGVWREIINGKVISTSDTTIYIAYLFNKRDWQINYYDPTNYVYFPITITYWKVSDQDVESGIVDVLPKSLRYAKSDRYYDEEITANRLLIERNNFTTENTKVFEDNGSYSLANTYHETPVFDAITNLNSAQLKLTVNGHDYTYTPGTYYEPTIQMTVVFSIATMGAEITVSQGSISLTLTYVSITADKYKIAGAGIKRYDDYNSQKVLGVIEKEIKNQKVTTQEQVNLLKTKYLRFATLPTEIMSDSITCDINLAINFGKFLKVYDDIQKKAILFKLTEYEHIFNLENNSYETVCRGRAISYEQYQYGNPYWGNHDYWGDNPAKYWGGQYYG